MGEQYTFQGKVENLGDSAIIIYPNTVNSAVQGIVYRCYTAKRFVPPRTQKEIEI
jgi:hypothetical protein